MRISSCFPTLPNLSSPKSKKSFYKKMKLSDILKTSCKCFSMKFQEVKNSWNYLQYFAKEVEQNFMKEFLVNKRKRFNTISDTKTNTFHLKYTTLLSMQEQSQDLSLLLLQGLDCLILLSLWICWFFINRRLFEYLLRFCVHFLQISLLGLQEVATFDFSSCVWLVPFHEGSRKTSRRYCKFFAVV